MYRAPLCSGAGIGFRLVIPEHFGILRKGYERILRTQVNQTGQVSYVESISKLFTAPRRCEASESDYEMINYFARFRNRARLTPGPRPTGEGNTIAISSDARVSLGQNGAVFLHARNGVVFTSNHVGAQIWQGLLDREGVEAIAARISREAGMPHDLVRRDTAEFVAELETQGFLFRRIGCRA
jgi:hypothetical protein